MRVDHDVEHRTELRSGAWSPRLLVVVVAVLAAVVALVVLRDDGGPAPELDRTGPAAPTTGTVPTTRPLTVPRVLAVADAGGGLVPASAGDDQVERRPASRLDADALQRALAVDGRVVVLVAGQLLVGDPGGTFAPFGPADQVTEVVGSNEPRHVWARARDATLALVAVDGPQPSVRIELGADDVLGPATFGVVTTSRDGVVSWRRPSFDPTPVPIPRDRTPLDAGGGLVLVEAPDRHDGVRRFEAWSVVAGRRVAAFDVDPGDAADRPAAIAPDGSTVALPHRGSWWRVLDVASGEEIGRLASRDRTPVWVGGPHFAVAPTPHLVEIAGNIRHRPRWPLVAVAEASP